MEQTAKQFELKAFTRDEYAYGMEPYEYVYSFHASPFMHERVQKLIAEQATQVGYKGFNKQYFHPRKLIGFTATPNRSDGVRLNDVFSDIIFQRDLRWAIQEGWLCDIYCRRVNIGYDLSAVHSRNGDYAPGELDEAMDGTADAIAEAYYTMAKGATLIFAVSVRQCQEIASRIEGAEVVTRETKNRADIIRRFTDREVPCLVNCMVFTEGTDLPLVETVIIARPTQSDSLYTQMVGRGLRLHPDKTQPNLIDCVGVTGKASLCTAPTLLGMDMDNIPPKRREMVEGMLFELPDKAAMAQDTPESWIRNVEIVNLWAQGQKYNTHNVNWFRMPDSSMVCSLPNNRRMTIPPADHLGRVRLGGELVDMQTALDRAYQKLAMDYPESAYIWDLAQVKRWSNKPASDAQLRNIRRMLPGYDNRELTKGEASLILNRLFNVGRKNHDRSARAKSCV